MAVSRVHTSDGANILDSKIVRAQIWPTAVTLYSPHTMWNRLDEGVW